MTHIFTKIRNATRACGWRAESGENGHAHASADRGQDTQRGAHLRLQRAAEHAAAASPRAHQAARLLALQRVHSHPCDTSQWARVRLPGWRGHSLPKARVTLPWHTPWHESTSPPLTHTHTHYSSLFVLFFCDLLCFSIVFFLNLKWSWNYLVALFSCRLFLVSLVSTHVKANKSNIYNILSKQIVVSNYIYFNFFSFLF